MYWELLSLKDNLSFWPILLLVYGMAFVNPYPSDFLLTYVNIPYMVC